MWWIFVIIIILIIAYLKLGSYNPIDKFPELPGAFWQLFDKTERELSKQTYYFEINGDTIVHGIYDKDGTKKEIKKYRLVSVNSLNKFYKTDQDELLKFSKDSIAIYADGVIPKQQQYFEVLH
jgi:hypothetical protein